ncbi:hypothetical protein STEG23_012374 [Scotinomys teguina]
MAPELAQFENGAERRSRPTRRKRRRCPGNRSGPQWRREPGGDGGGSPRPLVPGNIQMRNSELPLQHHVCLSAAKLPSMTIMD